eukprot:UN18612
MIYCNNGVLTGQLDANVPMAVTITTPCSFTGASDLVFTAVFTLSDAELHFGSVAALKACVAPMWLDTTADWYLDDFQVGWGRDDAAITIDSCSNKFKKISLHTR